MEKSLYRTLHTNISILIYITAYNIKHRMDKAKEGQSIILSWCLTFFHKLLKKKLKPVRRGRKQNGGAGLKGQLHIHW